jgi:hypothetical protein
MDGSALHGGVARIVANPKGSGWSCSPHGRRDFEVVTHQVGEVFYRRQTRPTSTKNACSRPAGKERIVQSHNTSH